METVHEPLVDVELLESYIKSSGYRVDFIVSQVGISRQAFDKKRKGRYAFRTSEIYVLCDLLNIPNEDKKKIFYPQTTVISDGEET